MRRIAFIGIENADSEVLHGALRRNLGADAEINAFGRDVAAVTVAPFLVAKSKESGQLEGGNSVAYISGEADADLAKKIGRLSKAGVTVRNGWSDFKPEATEDEIAQWLATGEWPVPEPEPEEDEDAALLALLLDEDEEEEGDSEASAPVAVEEVETAPVAESSRPEVSDDDLMEMVAPAPEPVVEETPVYQSRRFDSMGANDGAMESFRRREAASAPVETDEDDDLPLPDFSGAPAPVEEKEELPSLASDDEGDDLPVFNQPSSSSFSEASSFSEDDDLPAFRATPKRYVAAPPDITFSDEEDDELPAFAPRTTVEQEPASRRLDLPEDDEDDDLPAFTQAAPVEPRDEDDDLPAYLLPRPEPESNSTPSASPFSIDDEDDDLPVFRTPTAPSREREELPVNRRESRDLPMLDDEDDDLPAFTPAAPVRDEAPAYARSEAPAYARPSAPVDEDDALPVFNPAPVEAEAAPMRRSRRDFLRAAESLAAADQETAPRASSDDEDGDDLPVFNPQFSAAKVEEDDDLPMPVRRTSVADEKGDDLPEFTPRAVSPVAAEEEDESEDEESFEFAPKVRTPRYAAPAERQPSWGVPVQQAEGPVRPAPVEVQDEEDDLPVARPERVTEREPVRKEPARKVAPEEVRYEQDNPSEVIAKLAARRREAEGYKQPEIEKDVPNRELRPEPGAAPELRPAAKRVVNQRPATPIEDDSLNFMGSSDEVNDFNPDATPPFMEALQPEQRRAQSTMEQIRREYDADSVMKIRSKGKAVCYYVTGSHGGAGKTTSTWMMANTMAAALKKDPSRPVFLIEGDYENSKLAQRLNLPPEKNSGRLAELYRTLSSDRSLISKQKINMFEMTEKIIKESIYVNDHGVNIIAAPYDLTKRDGRFLRIAIQKSVEYAERQGGYVFIDADTLSNDDILDRTLAAKATHVVLVSFGDKDHVDDTHRAIHTLTTANVKSVAGSQTNGMGVPKDRIKLFFNKTGAERYEDLERTMRPYLTEGHLPTVPGLNDGGWIGNLTGSDFLNAVTSYASFMNRISPMEELRPYQQRRPAKGTQRSSFMKMFGSRRG